MDTQPVGIVLNGTKQDATILYRNMLRGLLSIILSLLLLKLTRKLKIFFYARDIWASKRELLVVPDVEIRTDT